MATLNIAGMRRQAKNVAYNYSETQRKVREATSNDPWGPSSSLMSELADMTHNTVAFTEIMQILWKRLNDHGKNWRHVYKSLVVLDFLIKCGSEKVAQQCRENIFSIETLKDFQHIEENKDQGHNIRQKAQALAGLLKDEEKLKNERTKAHMARKRFAQNNMSMGSDGQGGVTRRQLPRQSDAGSEFEEARPTSVGEEELQLQIALAMSKEEAEREEEARRGDDVRLQMALDESKHNASPTQPHHAQMNGENKASAVDDLLSLSLGQPGGGNAANTSAGYPQLERDTNSSDPWAPAPPAYSSVTNQSSSSAVAASNGDPWATPAADNRTGLMSSSSALPPATQSNGAGTGGNLSTSLNDPWAPPSQPQPQHNALGRSSAAANDPWAPTAPSPVAGQTSARFIDGATAADPWGSLSSSAGNAAGGNAQRRANDLMQTRAATKTPESFLGENSNLVNLDDLLGTTNKANPVVQPAKSASSNPFLAGAPAASAGGQPATGSGAHNPFAAQQRPSPTLNQIRTEGQPPTQQPSGDWALAQPIAPTRATNPFM